MCTCLCVHGFNVSAFKNQYIHVYVLVPVVVCMYSDTLHARVLILLYTSHVCCCYRHGSTSSSHALVKSHSLS